MMGVCGLFFFIVGYARVRNDLFFSVRATFLVPSDRRLIQSLRSTFNHVAAKRCHIPYCCALVRRLTMVEPDLLERLCEGVLP